MAPNSAVILLSAVVLFCVASALPRHSSTNREDPTGKAALIGLRALNRLMSGAREVSRPDINPREYVKKGGIFSAVDDFYAAFPDNIRVFQEQNKIFVQTGTIGDRTLVVKGGESIRPTLTIFRTEEANDPEAIRHVITYTRNEKLLRAPKEGLDY